MSFKLNPNPTFKSKVAIPVPGKSKPEFITFEFKHKTRDAVKQVFDEFSEEKKTDIELVLAIAVSWDVTDDGEPAEFNEENLEILSQNFPASIVKIIETYTDEVMGTARKN